MNKNAAMSLYFTCEIEFLTFNFMDENKSSTQINFLPYSHKVTDRTLQVKTSFSTKRKDMDWSHLLICMHNPSVYNLKEHWRKADWFHKLSLNMHKLPTRMGRGDNGGVWMGVLSLLGVADLTDQSMSTWYKVTFARWQVKILNVF